MLTSFEKSHSGRVSNAQLPKNSTETTVPKSFLRSTEANLPEMSELQVVRHFTSLSQKNFCIDTHFYPLGSCTMKYNPRAANKLASLEGFLKCHPLSSSSKSVGYLKVLYDLQENLKHITGMTAVSLTPMAGAQGEFAGVCMIKRYHEERGDTKRTDIIVPDAAHGTNPASASMCGYTVKELPTNSKGDVDLEALKLMVGPTTAGIMLTNPSTLGVFERNVQEIASIVHNAGGLLYYDGANLNAILGKYRPGDMGFDVLHLNLHKTFATPHGGGGPGAGPVLCNNKLKDYLPCPIVVKSGNEYRFSSKEDLPKSIGRLNTFMGNAGVLVRAYIYIRMLGREGLPRVGEYATLNANYLMIRLKEAGFKIAYDGRRATHEFIITLQDVKNRYGVSALDFAKRLLDKGFHAPTIYFPLLVPECFLIEPTETEDLNTLDNLVEAMKSVLKECKENADIVKKSPHLQPVGRIDEVAAAKNLDLSWKK